jgi:hypothetical protein
MQRESHCYEDMSVFGVRIHELAECGVLGSVVGGVIFGVVGRLT